MCWAKSRSGWMAGFSTTAWQPRSSAKTVAKKPPSELPMTAMLAVGQAATPWRINAMAWAGEGGN